MNRQEIERENCAYHSENEVDLINLFDELCSSVETRMVMDNFKFLERLREEEDHNPLKTTLGVHRKGKLHSGDVKKNMIQKESKPIVKRYLHKWFT